ncbi:MAG: hypothetical protein V4450_04505 [Bacteroidota bacterium]
MKTASIQELKQELQSTSQNKLLDLCLRLAKFKKENKELLTFLLFESHDEEAYISGVKALIDEGFTELPKPSLYLTKKSLRKILRIANRYIKYSGSKLAEASLLIHFCSNMKHSGIPYAKSTVLNNIYEMQLKKIGVAMGALHEDIQYDLQKELDVLM